MPHLATALALTFASRYAGGLLDKDVFRGKELVDSRPLQALVAGLKAYSTWENISCLQDCPECTGGMGYMMENQISGLKCDTDVFVTFEGDNVVMLQVVVRELLARYTKQHQEKPLSPVFRDWAESGSDKLRTSFLAFDVDTIGNLAFLLKAVNFCERALRRSLVARIHYKFCLLYGTKLVFQERAWYLEHKYLTPTASTRIRSQQNLLTHSSYSERRPVVFLCQ
uniref:acyl-coenzyme A oxidase-like protein n=1 Tax=Panthera onca TaxID=9690 RepID=UPI002955C140|nr:acyl-coenzyme A oxidase-like protein [Panthera onca]XP_060510625.1 acyl-coenzyme A oxidase-like protein [Panthera onca]